MLLPLPAGAGAKAGTRSGAGRVGAESGDLTAAPLLWSECSMIDYWAKQPLIRFEQLPENGGGGGGEAEGGGGGVC